MEIIDAIKRLVTNGIAVDGTVLYLPERGPGLKLWGVIEGLCKRHGYHWVRGRK